MSTKVLKVGIAGVGLWAERAHLPAFTHFPEIEVVGLADPDQNRSRQLASEFGVSGVYADYDELLSAGIDVLAIAAPTDCHHMIASSALRHNMHVLCEKPLARTIEEAWDLRRLAQRTSAITGMGFVLRFSPAFQQLRDMSQAGHVGEIHSVLYYGNFPQFFDDSTPYHWIMNSQRTGGGVHVEYGCHALDLARCIAGDISDVCGISRCLRRKRKEPSGFGYRTIDVDEVCSWLANFSGGAEGVFHVSWGSAPSFGVEFAIFGNKGALGWRRTDAWPFAELLSSTDPHREMHVLPIDKRYTQGLEWATTWRACFMGGLVRQLVKDIEGMGVQKCPSFEDGWHSQRGLKAIATSLREKRWVALNEVDVKTEATPTPGSGEVLP